MEQKVTNDNQPNNLEVTNNYLEPFYGNWFRFSAVLTSFELKKTLKTQNSKLKTPRSPPSGAIAKAKFVRICI